MDNVFTDAPDPGASAEVVALYMLQQLRNVLSNPYQDAPVADLKCKWASELKNRASIIPGAPSITAGGGPRQCPENICRQPLKLFREWLATLKNKNRCCRDAYPTLLSCFIEFERLQRESSLEYVPELICATFAHLEEKLSSTCQEVERLSKGPDVPESDVENIKSNIKQLHNIYLYILNAPGLAPSFKKMSS